MLCDFHLHSTLSDGLNTCNQIIKMAEDNGLSAIAFTDHDVVHTDLEMIKSDVSIIPGIELSTSYFTIDGKHITPHLIGLGYRDPEAIIRLLQLDSGFDRDHYMNEIIKYLKQVHGISVEDYESLKSTYKNRRYVGRSILAYELSRSLGMSIESVFDNFVGNQVLEKHGICVTDFSNYPSLKLACRAVVDSGGIPVLCHPLSYHLSEQAFYTLISDYREMNSKQAAIEVFYAKYNDQDKFRLLQIANQNDLLISSGSDFHGRKHEKLISREDESFKYDPQRHVTSLLL